MNDIKACVLVLICATYNFFSPSEEFLAEDLVIQCSATLRSVRPRIPPHARARRITCIYNAFGRIRQKNVYGKKRTNSD